MDKNNTIFQEFRGYWQLSEEMIAKASKEELAETAPNTGNAGRAHDKEVR